MAKRLKQSTRQNSKKKTIPKSSKPNVQSSSVVDDCQVIHHSSVQSIPINVEQNRHSESNVESDQEEQDSDISHLTVAKRLKRSTRQNSKKKTIPKSSKPNVQSSSVVDDCQVIHHSPIQRIPINVEQNIHSESNVESDQEEQGSDISHLTMAKRSKQSTKQNSKKKTISKSSKPNVQSSSVVDDCQVIHHSPIQRIPINVEQNIHSESNVESDQEEQGSDISHLTMAKRSKQSTIQNSKKKTISKSSKPKVQSSSVVDDCQVIHHSPIQRIPINVEQNSPMSESNEESEDDQTEDDESNYENDYENEHDMNEINLIGNNHYCCTKLFFPELYNFEHLSYKPENIIKNVQINGIQKNFHLLVSKLARSIFQEIKSIFPYLITKDLLTQISIKVIADEKYNILSEYYLDYRKLFPHAPFGMKKYPDKLTSLTNVIVYKLDNLFFTRSIALKKAGVWPYEKRCRKQSIVLSSLTKNFKEFNYVFFKKVIENRMDSKIKQTEK
ncbi:hypothetical protein BLOT_005327 [Blomia tropicalis]|nr:hypothetical protein BLOT_005327 [Blomia tropicalis]